MHKGAILPLGTPPLGIELTHGHFYGVGTKGLSRAWAVAPSVEVPLVNRAGIRN